MKVKAITVFFFFFYSIVNAQNSFIDLQKQLEESIVSNPITANEISIKLINWSKSNKGVKSNEYATALFYYGATTQNQDSSLKYFLSSKEVFESINDTCNEYYEEVFTNLGVIYQDLKEFHLAEEFFLQAMNVEECLFNMRKDLNPNVFYNLAYFYLYNKDYFKADIYFKIMNDFYIRNDLANTYEYFDLMIDYSEMLIDMNNLQAAESNLKRLNNSFHDIGSESSSYQSKIFSLLSKIYFIKEQKATALSYLKESNNGLTQRIDSTAIDCFLYNLKLCKTYNQEEFILNDLLNYCLTLKIKNIVYCTQYVDLLFAAIPLNKLKNKSSEIVEMMADLKKAMDKLDLNETIYKIRYLNLQANLIEYNGEYSEAINFYSQAIKFAECNNYVQTNEYATSLTSLGRAYLAINDYKYAESNLIKGYDLELIYGNQIDINNVLYNLIRLNLYIGNYSEAENLFGRINNFNFSNDIGLQDIPMLSLKIAFMIDKHQDNEAIKLLEKISNSFTDIDEFKNIFVFPALISIYLNNRSYDSAFYYANKLNLIDELSSVNWIAQIHFKKGEWILAKKYYEKLIDMQKSIRSEEVILANLNLAILNSILDKDVEAINYFSKYANLLNQKTRDSFGFMSTAQKQKYITSLPNYNNFIFKIYEKNPDYSKIIFDQTILLKRILIDNNLDIKSTVKDSKDKKLNVIYKQLLNSKYKLQVHKEIFNVDSSLVSLLSIKIDSLEKLLVLQVGEYAALKRRFELRWTDIRNSLKGNDAAIEFTKYYDDQDSLYKYIAQVLRPNYEYPHIVKLCNEKEIEKYKGGNGLSDLYHLVWEPIDSLLVGVKTVYYSPDGLLYSVPFNALCTNDTAGCSYLMDKYTLHQLSTTRYLADSTLINTKPLNNTIALYGGINYEMVNDTNKNNQEETNEDYLFANTLKRETTFKAVDYLPGTKQEVESVVSVLNENKWTTTVATGTKATEQLFKSKSDTLAPSIIHIATHGFAFPDKEEKRKINNMDMLLLNNTQIQYTAADDPMMRCGLMFAGANKSWTGKQKEMIEQTGQDGILTAAEVANMDLSNAKLVVLSACETGLGKVEGSEGVFGLQRGFKLAGVEQLIVSLWKVPDHETMELMNLFYSDLTITKDPVISFSKAQKQMRNNYPDNPEKWAGFVLVR